MISDLKSARKTIIENKFHPDALFKKNASIKNLTPLKNVCENFKPK